MGEVLRECHVTKLVLFTRLGDFLVYFSLVEYVFFYNDVYELEYLKKIYEIIYMFNHNWCIFIKMFGKNSWKLLKCRKKNTKRS